MGSDKTPKELIQALDLIRSTKAPQLQSLDSLEARHVDRVRDIFQDPNIVAIGIAEKVTEKKATHELGLCFYVEKKLPRCSNRPYQKTKAWQAGCSPVCKMPPG